MTRLRAGALRHRVSFQRRTTTKKPGGGLVTSWDTIGPVAALVESLGGREATIGQALQGVSSYRITLRFRTDVTDADQLVWGDVTMNVRDVDATDPRRQQTVILADTGSAEAVAS